MREAHPDAGSAEQLWVDHSRWAADGDEGGAGS